MSRTKIVVGGLLVALIASNAWWAYHSIDRGISYSYLDASYATTIELLKQTSSILGVVMTSGATREEVIRAAQGADPTNVPFKKDGYVWVGQLGLKFNDQGQLTKVANGPEEAQ